MDASKVTAGKPKITGAVYRAPLGTTLPTSVTADLNSAFKEMGYVSDAGVVNSNSPSNTAIKAWGGDTVLNIQTSKDDTFKFTLIEVLNVDVLKFVFGEDNVMGDLDTGLTVKVNGKEVDEVSIVIDMILRNNTPRRIVIPDCKISNIEDISYVDNDAVGYGVTTTCMPDDAGNTHYEYTKRSGVSG